MPSPSLPSLHPDGHYLEDLISGQSFESGPLRVDKDEVEGFAQRYDPQIFHTDADRASETLFGRQVASGWHTAALSMRLMVVSDFRPACGIVGREVRSMAWPRPVVPGDILRLKLTIMQLRPSHSKPDRGIVEILMQTSNQHDDIVFEANPVIIIPRRP